MRIRNKLFLLAACVFAGTFLSCSGSGGDDADAAGPSAQKAATPTFSPNGGHFENSVGVTISCGTDGAEIRYTKDGSAPTSGSALYSGPISLDDGCTLKAVATKSGLADSDIATSSAYYVKTWRIVGSAGISGGDSAHLSIALDGIDVPYLAFADGGNGYKAYVKKWDGSSWTSVGSGAVSSGAANYLSLAIDPTSSKPYLAYQNASGLTPKVYNPPSNGKSVAVVWDGSNWASADGASIAADTAFTSLAISPSGAVFAAYQDASYSDYAVASVLSGGSWTVLGSWDISGTAADFIAAAVDSSDRFYVAYRDQNTKKASVKRYSSGWDFLGTSGISAGDAQYISIAVDSSSNAYLAYRDGAASDKATVLRYVSSSWSTLGGSGVSAGQADYTCIGLTDDNIPYLVYKDWAKSGKATVMKWTGEAWTPVGSAGFSAGTACYTCIALASDGTPFVAFRDGAAGGKATVMKYSE